MIPQINSPLELLQGYNYELACDDMRDAYIGLTIDGKKMLFRIQSSEFQRLLDYRYMEANHAAIAPADMKLVLKYLIGKALYESPTIQPDIRVQGDESTIEIDLGDGSYQVACITAEGFQLAQPNQYFVRRHGLRPLPEPEVMSAEDIRQALADFKAILNVTDEQYTLVVGAMLMAFHPKGPYPVLFVQGEHGSAKGSLCEAIKFVVDPNLTPHTALPNNIADLVIQAASNRVLSFDNVSEYTFNKKISDMFAQVATGIGLRRRQLFTDDGESVINLSRMIMMNGIDDVVTQSDLASRTIGLRLLPITEDNRISKQEFQRRLVELQPRVFSALVGTLSAILGNFAAVHIRSGARMFDMIHWVTAAEPILGWPVGTFQRVFEVNQLEVMEVGLGQHPLPGAIIHFMRSRQQWTGEANQLLSNLEGCTELRLRRGPDWPRSPIALGQALNRFQTSLRQIGIEVTREARSSSSRRITLSNHNHV